MPENATKRYKDTDHRWKNLWQRLLCDSSKLFDYDGEVDVGNATTDEVAQVAWMNREQIKELFDANMFVDTLSNT